jgi:hypothetical protein
MNAGKRPIQGLLEGVSATGTIQCAVASFEAPPSSFAARVFTADSLAAPELEDYAPSTTTEQRHRGDEAFLSGAS